jgi:hypothetical protein
MEFSSEGWEDPTEKLKPLLFRHPVIHRNLRQLLTLLVVVASLAFPAGLAAAATSQVAQVPAPKPQPPPSGPQAPAATAVQFDLPPDWTRDANDAKRITGFRIGYFDGRRQRLLHAVEIAREEVMVNGGTGRIRLDLSGIADPADVIIRMQSLARGQASPWSESIAVVPGAPGRGATGARARATRRVTANEVERSPRLQAAWEKCVPAGARRDEVLAAFSRVEELAFAVVLCRDYEVNIEALSRKVQGPPRRSPAAAARELRPEVTQAVVRRARTAGRALLDKAPK